MSLDPEKHSELLQFSRMKILGSMFAVPLSIMLGLVVKDYLLLDMPIFMFIFISFCFYNIIISIVISYCESSVDKELMTKQYEDLIKRTKR